MTEENAFLFSFLEELDKKRESIENKINNIHISMTSIQDEIDNLTLKNNINNYYFLPLSSIDEQKRTELTKILDQSLLELAENEKELQKVIKKHTMFTTIFKKYQLFEMNNIVTRNHKNSLKNFSEEGLGIQVLETQELERKRIARELHDSTVQNLTNFAHKTELCMKLVDIDTIRAKLELQSMIESIHSTIHDMRGIIYDLRPMSIDDLGLSITIQRYMKQLQDNYANLKFSFQIINEDNYNNSIVNLTLFRIIQEACNNSLKYSKASNITIILEYSDDLVKLQIEDDGIGFDTNHLEKKRNHKSGFGLSIMKERIFLLSGNIEIESKRNRGTLIKIVVPYDNTREEEDK